MKTIDELKADWALACYNSRHSSFHLIQAGDLLIEALEKELYGWRNQRIYIGAGFRDAQGNWTPTYQTPVYVTHHNTPEYFTLVPIEHQGEIEEKNREIKRLMGSLIRAEQEVRRLQGLIHQLYDGAVKDKEGR